MKAHLKVLFIAIISFCFLAQAQAQTSVKDMDKKTKAELKEYIKEPASYRKMIKGYKDQIDSYELELNEVREDFYKADYLRTLYYDSIMELQNQLNAMVPIEPIKSTQDATGNTLYAGNGTEYRVQIGAYRYFDFTQLLKFNQPIGYEKVNGVIHYYLGSWTSANEAYDFAVALRKLKIKDAFVSKYVNGSRVPYDHLVEGGQITAYTQE